MAKQNIMTIASLKKLFEELKDDVSDDFQIWLSSDEEGNMYLPVHDDPRLFLSIEHDQKRIILFPSHQ